MRRKFSPLNTVILSTMLAHSGYRYRDNGLDYEFVPDNRDRMPLTHEEALKLSEMKGKEKKAFVKELKQKYAQNVQEKI
jgi:hypothetical protein